MAITMKPLTEPDTHHLRAAHGWIGLGNLLEANEELEKIAAPFRAHPDVLEIKSEIYARAEKWNMAAEIGRALVRIRPGSAHSWISHAYATRRMPGGGIPQAKEILDKAEPMFPNVWTIPYAISPVTAHNWGNLTNAKGGSKRQWLLMGRK